VLERIAPFSESVTDEIVQAWIAPITASVSNPRPKGEAAAWFGALMLALDGLPVGVFTWDPARPAAPLYALASGG
jgi:hypothetical protein